MPELDLKPTAEMAANAARGLELREKHGKGGTAVGVARARDIKNRANLSPSTVRRMHSFFSRHEGNQAGGEDDAGYIAWLLWGGDAGKAWAARKSAQIDKMKSARFSHDIRLPKGKRRLNIDEAHAALAQMGYKLGTVRYDPAAGGSVYKVTQPNGSVIDMPAAKLTDLIYQKAKHMKSGTKATMANELFRVRIGNGTVSSAEFIKYAQRFVPNVSRNDFLPDIVKKVNEALASMGVSTRASVLMKGQDFSRAGAKAKFGSDTRSVNNAAKRYLAKISRTRPPEGLEQFHARLKTRLAEIVRDTDAMIRNPQMEEDYGGWSFDDLTREIRKVTGYSNVAQRWVSVTLGGDSLGGFARAGAKAAFAATVAGAAAYTKNLVKSLGFYPDAVRFDTARDLLVLEFTSAPIIAVNCASKLSHALSTRGLGAQRVSINQSMEQRGGEDVGVVEINLDDVASRGLNSRAGAKVAFSESAAWIAKYLPALNQWWRDRTDHPTDLDASSDRWEIEGVLDDVAEHCREAVPREAKPSWYAAALRDVKKIPHARKASMKSHFAVKKSVSGTLVTLVPKAKGSGWKSYYAEWPSAKDARVTHHGVLVERDDGRVTLTHTSGQVVSEGNAGFGSISSIRMSRAGAKAAFAHPSWSAGLLGKETAPQLAAYSWIDAHLGINGHRTQMLLADIAAEVHARNPALSIQQAIMKAAQEMVQKGVATYDIRALVEDKGWMSRAGAKAKFSVLHLKNLIEPLRRADAAKNTREMGILLRRAIAICKAGEIEFPRSAHEYENARAWLEESLDLLQSDGAASLGRGSAARNLDNALGRIMSVGKRFQEYSRAGAKATHATDNMYYTVAAHIGDQPAGERTTKSLDEAKAYAKAMLAALKPNAKGKPLVVDVYPVVNYSPQASVLSLKASRTSADSNRLTLAQRIAVEHDAKRMANR